MSAVRARHRPPCFQELLRFRYDLPPPKPAPIHWPADASNPRLAGVFCPSFRYELDTQGSAKAWPGHRSTSAGSATTVTGFREEAAPSSYLRTCGLNAQAARRGSKVPSALPRQRFEVSTSIQKIVSRTAANPFQDGPPSAAEPVIASTGAMARLVNYCMWMPSHHCWTGKFAP